ncbi:Grap2/cyclin-D-interacting protein [Arabidopsis thaliana]|jgi:hypothetical protein|uniref:Expressed protein n=1 Tax=Arabidopsis thaliana TaxID=3702 RepID=Q5BPZ6_ARATH|nr:Grap2/cyclin-D-interacting protein [Arabidopsis thaliana]AAX23757.1 hypothetical protein At1g22980 [Arabidopsis thaliana]AAZ52685.1 expressed protein [Arabidopsis thaliana]AEE30317.1 Grap2/cyclin-D-interacting protein [Arabidopsis thaliana]|eukprot:NP_564185.2 Grap2/cyclin-D-interacting protein [Arabidopsis thaliana]
MGKSKKKVLNKSLITHPSTSDDTLQLFDPTSSPTKEKVNWNNVLGISDYLSKQATRVKTLWTGETPKAESVKETMESYFKALLGFLLCCHGSTLGAGPTLSSIVHGSVKQIVDSSFRLFQGSVSLYDGSYEKGEKPSISQLSGAVLEACSSFKKVPTTNLIAIGSAISQVSVIMKDVLNEMKKVKPACPSSEGEASGDDFSPEQIEVAKMVADIVYEAMTVIIVIRVITRMMEKENSNENSVFVESLEKLLKLCQRSGVVIEELGTCVYHPPLKIDKITQTVKILEGNLDEVEAQVEYMKRSSNAFPGVCRKLRDAIKLMEVGLEKRKDLNQILISRQNTLYNALQLLDPTASPMNRCS